jgi:WD40 repeat protein
MFAMTRGPVLLLVCAGGCFSPSAAPGSPCSADGTCPRGLECVANTCQPPGTEPDAAPPLDDAPVDAPPRLWSAPTPVPGVNSSSSEDDPSFTADRLTVVFISNRNGTDDEIFIGTRPDPDGDFTVALIEPLSAPGDEASPEISPDGTTLYFISDRGGGDDVFVSTRPPGGAFSTPTLVAELSSTSSEGDIAISPDGLTAIVLRGSTLVRSTRPTTSDAWSTPIAITGVAFGTSPAAPSLDAAGDLYFHAGTQRDLFVARAQGASYAAPVPITELNGTGRDSGPYVSPDETFIMFAKSGQIVQSTR